MKRESLPSLSTITIAAVLFSAASLTAVYFYSRTGVNRQKTVSGSEVSMQDSSISQKIRAVSALGYLQPKGKIINLSAPSSIDGTTTRLSAIFVEENDFVLENETVAVLDSEESRKASLRQSQAELEIAIAELNRANAGTATQGGIESQEATTARSEAELRNATAEYERFDALFRAGAISESERDRKLMMLETAQATLLEAQAAGEEIVEVRPVDVAVAEARVSNARALVEKASAELERVYIRTPIPGQVLKVHSRPGEIIGREGVLEIAQTDEMMVIAEVYETDIDRVEIGQKVVVISGATTGKLQGTVSKIGLQVSQQESFNTDPTATTDNRVVEVEITLDDESNQTVKGLSNLQVQVVIQV